MNGEDRRCSICGGRSTPGLTTYLYQRDGEVFVFERVPAWICGQCGERSFAGPAVELIERLVREMAPPTRLLSARLYDLAEQRFLSQLVPDASCAPR